MESLSERKELIAPLAESIGSFIQFWGFKKVHGRIWTHIFLSKHPLDALELRRRLSISKALVSLTLKDLIRYKIIESAGRSTRGTMTYRPSQVLEHSIFQVLETRELQLLKNIQQAFTTIHSLEPEAQGTLDLHEENLVRLKHLIEYGMGCLQSIMNSKDLFSSIPARAESNFSSR